MAPSQARLIFGPLSLRPRIALSNFGIDTNVFNDPAKPSRDLTATLVPGLDATLRIGRARLLSRTGLELLYFAKARSQRSAGLSQDLRFEAPLARVTPFVFGGRAKSHQRPNFEIDERVEQTTLSAGGGLTLRVGPRARATFGVARQQLAYGATATSSVAGQLSRRDTAINAGMEVDLTPLTTFVFQVESQQSRFTEQSLRDSDGLGLQAGFQFEPLALLSGTVLIGYRHVTSLRNVVADFNGLTANVNVGYLWRERVRLSAAVHRSLDFSVDTTQPFYVSTGGTLTLTQALFRRWDVQARLGREFLAYRERLDLLALVSAGRTDRVVLYGTGVGFRVTDDARVSFDMNYVRRLSPQADRTYDGFRFGGSLSYVY